MKNIMTKAAALLSGILMLLAIVGTGPDLAEAVLDLFGYVIYLAVFAAPVWYFYSLVKKEKNADATGNL